MSPIYPEVPRLGFLLMESGRPLDPPILCPPCFGEWDGYAYREHFTPFRCAKCKQSISAPKPPVTVAEAKRLVRQALASLGRGDLKITAKTIGFTDLARASCIFVKVHGWTPHNGWRGLQELARANGFRMEAAS